MKKFLVLVVVFLVLINPFNAQENKPSCCNMDQNSVFANLANDQNFVKSHDEPKDYKHETKEGKTIVFATPDGSEANAFLLSKEESNKWLIVVHEWWGLNEYIKKEAEKLFHDLKEVNVIAIDLYDGKVANTAEKAGEYMKGVKTARAENIIKGAFDFAGKDAEFASIGWCFGGGWSLQTAIMAGNRSIGSIVYYGMPEQDVAKLALINGPVLGIFASRDKWINPEVVAEFERNMKAADKQLTVYSYEADHAFANPSSERYNGDSAKDAYQKSLGFLLDVLQTR